MKLSGGERWDLDSFTVSQSAHRTDSKFLIREFFAQNNQVFRGFIVSGLGTNAANVALADSTLVLPQNTTDFSYFAAPTGATPITVAAASLTNNTRNFLELKLTTVDGTPLSKVFWDSTVNSGAGAEFSQVVNTVTDLAVTVSVLTTAFSGSVDALPLAILDVDNGGLITSVFDRRDLFGRLAKPGNLANEFSWGTKVDPVFSLTLTGVTGTFIAGEALTIGGETATVVTGGTTSITLNKVSGVSFFPGTSTATGGTSVATGTVSTFTESFVGVDKNIHTVEDAVKALMTEMKKIKGTSAWYEDAPGNLSSVGIPFGVGTNSGANVQIVTFAIPFTTLTKGMHISYSPNIANTGPATLKVDLLGAVSIGKLVDQGLVNLGPGDLGVGFVHDMSYSGTQWILNNPATALTDNAPSTITGSWTFSTNPTFNAGSITTTEISDGTILDTDISASAAIVDTKLATITTADKVSDTALNIPNVKFMSTYADFATAVSTIGAAVTTLVIPEVEVVASNVTVPSTLHLQFQGLGELSVSATFTVTINGPHTASPKKVFSGAGSIDGLTVSRSVWFGDTGDGTTLDSTAINSAITSLGTTGGLVHIHYTGSPHLMDASISVPSNVTLMGENFLVELKRGPGVGNIFDMVVNSAGAGGNTNVFVENIKVDGNDAVDSLTNANAAHRFAGIRLRNCTNSKIKKVEVINTVTGEIQVEGNRAAIILEDCNDCEVDRIGVNSNQGSGLFIYKGFANRISNVSGTGNDGSTITSTACDRSSFSHLKSVGSGFSGISLNGLDIRATDLFASGAALGFSGVTIGHDNAGDRSHRAVVTNVHCESNLGWGIVIFGSDDVSLSNFSITNTAVVGLRVFGNSNRAHISNGVSIGSTAGNGVNVESGVGHQLVNVTSRLNEFSGVELLNTSRCSLVNVKATDNGQGVDVSAGGCIINSTCNDIEVIGGDYSDYQGTKTQDNGLWVAGGSGHKIDGPRATGNLTNNYRESGSPTNMVRRNIRITDETPSVASAATITLGGVGKFITVTGTTAITSITATIDQADRLVVLTFTGILTFTDGLNLNLAGNFVTTANDSITLICDGVNWTESSRSPN